MSVKGNIIKCVIVGICGMATVELLMCNSSKLDLGIINESRSIETNKSIDLREESIDLREESIDKVVEVESDIKEVTEGIRVVKEEELKEFIGEEYSNISVYYFNLVSRESFQINSRVIQHTASTIKVPIVMIILDMINEGTIGEQETMNYIEEYDYEEGAGELQYIDKSEPIQIIELCEYAIKYSDNIAVNMLIRRIGYGNILDILNTSIGNSWGDKPNQASAYGMSNVLKRLYYGDNPYYTKELEWLKNTIFHDRLDKYVTECEVAHKIGDYEGYVHDTGIVYAEEPYILTIYTNGLIEPHEKIANISKIIFDMHNSKGN